MTPDLSVLGTTARTTTPNTLPPPPTNDDEQRFLYLLHRPGDLSFANADGVQRILASGGVGAHIRSKENMRSIEEAGIDESVQQFIAHDLNEKQRLSPMSSGFKSLLSWFYLNLWQGREIRTLAGEDELVFRVPETWLRQNALSCLEWPVNGQHRSENGARLWAWAFLTPLVVPIEYRIVSSTPLVNEAKRALSNSEVAAVVYQAHIAEDASSRDENVYNRESAPEPASEPDGEAPPINPF